MGTGGPGAPRDRPVDACTLEVPLEEGGRLLAEVIDLPVIMAYGPSPDEALALRMFAGQFDHHELRDDRQAASASKGNHRGARR